MKNRNINTRVDKLITILLLLFVVISVVFNYLKLCEKNENYLMLAILMISILISYYLDKAAALIIALIIDFIYATICRFLRSCAPFIVALVSFATFIFMDEKNNLDPNTAFVSLTLFSMLRFPLNFIPYIITGLIQVICN